MFGELLAFQFAEWLARLPSERVQIVEAGAHDGRLAADILCWLRQWRPALFARVEYLIGEPSPGGGAGSGNGCRSFQIGFAG